jgi:hypothetical protein
MVRNFSQDRQPPTRRSANLYNTTFGDYRMVSIAASYLGGSGFESRLRTGYLECFLGFLPDSSGECWDHTFIVGHLLLEYMRSGREAEFNFI